MCYVLRHGAFLQRIQDSKPEAKARVLVLGSRTSFLSHVVSRPQTFRVHNPLIRARSASDGCSIRGQANFFEGFDSGSERTLAAWIRHASRTNPHCCSNTVVGGSGERGSKAWVTYPGDRHSRPNGRIIPGDIARSHGLAMR